MTEQDFVASLAGAAPPARLPSVLAALWWMHRGAWDQAHAIVQDEPGPEAAWVHAHLHRLEGDVGNAAYWYRRAGRPVASGAARPEREAITAALLRLA